MAREYYGDLGLLGRTMTVPGRRSTALPGRYGGRREATSGERLMRRFRAMVTVFSAVLSEADHTESETGTTVAWSVVAGKGRHRLQPLGGVVDSPPLAVVHFGSKPRVITDGAGAHEIARAQDKVLDVTGPVLANGRYTVRPGARVWSLLTSSTRFTVRRDHGTVMTVRETSHNRRTVRVFDVQMAEGFDPNVGLALLLMFGGVSRQKVLGELFEGR